MGDLSEYPEDYKWPVDYKKYELGNQVYAKNFVQTKPYVIKSKLTQQPPTEFKPGLSKR